MPTVSRGIFDNWAISYNKSVLQKVEITSCHLAEWRHRSCTWPFLESTLGGKRVSGCVLLVQGGAESWGKNSHGFINHGDLKDVSA